MPKISSKIFINTNRLKFIYEQKEINMKLTLNKNDKIKNEIKIIVLEKEHEGIICSKCGELITLDLLNSNYDNILSKKNNLVINNNQDLNNNIIYQLKNIISIVDNIIYEINKNNEEIQKIKELFKEINRTNIIEGILNMELKNIQNKNIVSNLNGFFEKNSNILTINLSNFNNDKLNEMEWFFNENFKMKEIKGINKSNSNYTTLTEDITNLLKIHKLESRNIKAKKMLESLLLYSWPKHEEKYIRMAENILKILNSNLIGLENIDEEKIKNALKNKRIGQFFLEQKINPKLGLQILLNQKY